MSKYRMDDGTVVDTANATAEYPEQRDFDGNNRIGRSSGSQWHDQTLYRSRKGRYYIETLSRYQGQRDRVEWVSHQVAAAFLSLNDYDIPADLATAVAEISE